MSEDKYYRYRAAVVRFVDSLFCEPGNRKRSRTRCHRTITLPLCGIGIDSHSNYLHYPEEAMKDYRLPEDLQHLLRLFIRLRTHYPEALAARILALLDRNTALALEKAKPIPSDDPKAAERLLWCLLQTLAAEASGKEK